MGANSRIMPTVLRAEPAVTLKIVVSDALAAVGQ